ncbi:MAG: hypothetical protein U0354_13710 [Candidatus Sericytochromatia bacterium]
MCPVGVNNNSIYNSLLLGSQVKGDKKVQTSDNQTSNKNNPVTSLTPQEQNNIKFKGNSQTSNQEIVKEVKFVNGQAQVSNTKTSPTDRPKNLDDVSTFHKTDIATAADIDKILKRYNSPHAGKGQVIFDMCKKYNVNPIMVLAVMQQESQFGSTKLKPENTANPWSVHFNHGAKGIAKLRLPNGQLPTFEQSLEGGIKTIVKLAGNSSTPLSTAGSKYSESGNWTKMIKQHYNTLLTRY